jgi:CheY-like chemotaxis protein
MCATVPFDVIFIDVCNPQISGLEVVRALRYVPNQALAPIPRCSFAVSDHTHVLVGDFLEIVMLPGMK